MGKNSTNYNLSKNSMVDFNKLFGGEMAKNIARTKQLLDSFDSTNNGVMYYAPNNKVHKGGTNIKSLNTCTLFGYSDKKLDICDTPSLILDFMLFNDIIIEISQDYIKINYIKDTIADRCGADSNANIDDILLKYYINNNVFPAYNIKFPYNEGQYIGNKLKEYIDKNKKSNLDGESNILYYDKHGKYSIEELNIVGKKTKYNNQEGELEEIQDFKHSGYNKDIVEAYEKNYINNLKNLPDFMKEQYDYIKDLTITQKIIINDYTKKSCFDFYLAYASKLIGKENLKTYINKEDGSWLDAYKEWKKEEWRKKLNIGDITQEEYKNMTDYINDYIYNFGDSFYKQIFDVIGEDSFNNIIIQFMNNKYGIHQAFYENKDINTIEKYWIFIFNTIEKDREPPNAKSIFHDKLTNKQWDHVMRIFIEDINNIIAGAPPCKTDIYCYRAVSNDYIDIDNDTDIINIEGNEVFRRNERTYINTRIGSFSLNFNSSWNYLPEEKGKKIGTMYRAVIHKGVKVLYIAGLSFASHEFEILHASYGIFVDKKEPYLCYNNKNNKYGILSYQEDQFKSALVGLAGYARTIDRNIFNKTIDSLQNSYERNKDSIKNIIIKHAKKIINSNKVNEEIRKNKKVDITINENFKTLPDTELEQDIEALENYVKRLEEEKKDEQIEGGAKKTANKASKRTSKGTSKKNAKKK
jgi:hypothetical protein